MAKSSHSRGVATFEGFSLDLESGELRRDGVPQKLQPQPSKVLVLLVANAGSIVTRNELAEQVWGSDTFVDFEQGLNFAIRQIRTVLGDDANVPRFVETIPKRGYRFIAPVQQVTPEPSDIASPPQHFVKPSIIVVSLTVLLLSISTLTYVAAHHAKPLAPPRRIILAVLPFDDLSSDPQPFLVEGLTEEMATRVTQISPDHLQVIARTSAMQYANTKKSARQIGQELGADYILENSIRHEGGRLRITSQLIRPADQVHLWAENYDRDMSQLLPVESEVTSDIAEQIQRQLLPKVVVNRRPNVRRVDPDAHELYVKGTYYLNQRSQDGLRQSVAYFQQAVAKQPDYAEAYAGLADAYNLFAFYGFDPTLTAVSQAKVSADKALQIDESVAAAHAARAYTEFLWLEDWADSEKEFRRALEIDDNDVSAHQWYALYLAGMGRMDESLYQMKYAQNLDPLSASVHAGYGYMYYFARDYDRAIEQARLALQLNPNSMAAHAVVGWAYTRQKKFPEAIAELKTATKLSGGVPVYRGALAQAYALSGNLDEAKKTLAEMEAQQHQLRGSGSAIAGTYLALGDSEKALHWLEDTAIGDIPANWLRVDPAFDPIRQNPRFLAVVSRVGQKVEPKR